MGRTFALAKENWVSLNVRAEFQNLFNRLYLSSPTPTTPVAPTSANGFGGFNGYGYVNTVLGAGSSPRSGQIIARLRF